MKKIEGDEINETQKSIKKLSLKPEYKAWLQLIEYHPKIPRPYGLSKTSKPNQCSEY